MQTTAHIYMYMGSHDKYKKNKKTFVPEMPDFIFQSHLEQDFFHRCLNYHHFLSFLTKFQSEKQNENKKNAQNS